MMTRFFLGLLFEDGNTIIQHSKIKSLLFIGSSNPSWYFCKRDSKSYSVIPVITNIQIYIHIRNF